MSPALRNERCCFRSLFSCEILGSLFLTVKLTRNFSQRRYFSALPGKSILMLILFLGMYSPTLFHLAKYSLSFLAQLKCQLLQEVLPLSTDQIEPLSLCALPAHSLQLHFGVYFLCYNLTIFILNIQLGLHICYLHEL